MPGRRAVEARGQRRGVVFVGGAEDRHDRRPDRAGQVHRTGIVGDDGVRAFEHAGQRRQVGAADEIDQRGERRAPARQRRQRVAQLGAGRGVAAGPDDGRGQPAIAKQDQRQLGEALGRPLLGPSVGRARRHHHDAARRQSPASDAAAARASAGTAIGAMRGTGGSPSALMRVR